MEVDCTKPRWVLAVQGVDHLRYRAIAIVAKLAELDSVVDMLRQESTPVSYEIVEIAGKACADFPLRHESATVLHAHTG